MQVNKIIQGDCLEVMKDIPDKSIDMILCDLPYGTTACKWDTIIPFEPLWEQYKRIIKDNGAIVLTASQPFTSALVMSNINGFAFAMVWNKCFGANFVQAKRQPIKDHEDVLVFSKNGTQPNYYPQMIKRDNPIKKGGNKQSAAIPIAITEKSILFGKGGKTYYEKYPTSQIRFSCREGRGLHPTQKPVALFEYLIKTYTNEGDLVLDNAAGSGTTGVACKNLNRNYILIEKEPEYVEIINKRLTIDKQ
jgi:site-specific DNA-methyltransferase (adenine-specific)